MSSSTDPVAPRRQPGHVVPGRFAHRVMQWAAATILFTVIGPFGTFNDLETPWRALYWGFAMLSGFIIIEPVLYRAMHLAYARNWHWPTALVAGILAATVPLTASILVLERLLRHPSPAEAVPLALLYGYVLAVTILVGGVPIVLELYRHGLLAMPDRAMPVPAATSTEPEARTPPMAEPPGTRLLNRLPAPKRGAILALSMEDHYVRVFTDAGDSLVLLRLSDAMAEVQGIPGLQIHRSHWVAGAAVERSERLPDGRLRLHLVNGLTLPVSRTYAKAVRDAGFAGRAEG